jgi:hypothetical protein
VARVISIATIVVVLLALLAASLAPEASAGLRVDVAAQRTPGPNKTPKPKPTPTATTTVSDTTTTTESTSSTETTSSQTTTTTTQTSTTTTTTTTTTGPTPPPCTPSGSNPIVAENTCPGSTGWLIPASGAQVANDVNKQIKGYANKTSVNKGSTIDLKVTVTPAQAFTIDIYRLGWYGGAGGRWMQSVPGLAGTTQPTCPGDANGTIQCSWATAYTLTVPSDWTSGLYVAVLTNASNYQNYISFAVRDDARPSDLLYQQPVTTYEAYNNYPSDGLTGKSLYTGDSYGSVTTSGTVAASKVSFDRPYTGNGSAGSGGFLWWEVDVVQWLERSGYDITYSTDVDTHENGSRLLNHRVVLSVGHDEYWSKQMFDAWQNARDGGTNLAFIGGNEVFWQIRFESSSSGASNRIITCYKNATRDPTTNAALKTITWRQVGRPEQTLIGIMYSHDIQGDNDYVVTNPGHWVFRGTNFVNGSRVDGIVGGEGDRYISTYPLPAYRYYDLLSNSPYTARSVSTPTSDYANSSIYQAPSRAWVFAVGTFQWGWGLNKPGYTDARIQRTTANVLAAMLDSTSPVVTPPRVTPIRSGQAGTTSIGATVSWSGTDPETFVDRFVLQQSTDGGAFVTIQDGTATSKAVTLTYGHTYQFRVTGADANNIWSGWKTGPVLTPAVFQQTSVLITYTGSWGTLSNASDLGGTHSYTSTSGASASVTFWGQSITIVAPKSPSGSNVSVYVDGVAYPSLSFYASSTTYRQVIATYGWGSIGTHTVKFVNLATSGRPYAYFDAFILVRSP